MIRCILCALLGCRRPRAGLGLTYIAGGIPISGENLMARITTEQTIEVSVNPTTAAGNPATIDGDAVFSADPASAGSFEQLSPTSARFTPSGETGAVQILVEVDADLDEGETRTLTASGALEILSPEAENLEVVFGEPQQA